MKAIKGKESRVKPHSLGQIQDRQRGGGKTVQVKMVSDCGHLSSLLIYKVPIL